MGFSLARRQLYPQAQESRSVVGGRGSGLWGGCTFQDSWPPPEDKNEKPRFSYRALDAQTLFWNQERG